MSSTIINILLIGRKLVIISAINGKKYLMF